MLQNFIIVGLGGALGSMVRYGLSIVFPLNTPFMVGVLLANSLGCFLLGMASQYQTSGEFSPLLRLFIYTGILGGLTTFSAIMLDIFKLYENQNTLIAIAYLVATLALGILAFYSGKAIM